MNGSLKLAPFYSKTKQSKYITIKSHFQATYHHQRRYEDGYRLVVGYAHVFYSKDERLLELRISWWGECLRS